MVMPQWNNTMNGKFEVKVYSGENKPDKLLYSQNVQLSYLNFSGGTFSNIVKPSTRNTESYIQFSKPIAVDKSFFISYTIQYPATDTLALLNVIERNTNLNTAYLRTATSQWITAPETAQSSPQTSLWIDPVVSWTDTSTTNKPTESGLRLYYSQSSHQLYLKGLILGESGNLTVYNSSGRSIWKSNVFADGIIEIPEIGQGYFIARLQTSEGITRLRFIRY
jgi:phosphoribosyl-AMP cyclohydrolase